MFNIYWTKNNNSNNNKKKKQTNTLHVHPMQIFSELNWRFAILIYV